MIQANYHSASQLEIASDWPRISRVNHDFRRTKEGKENEGFEIRKFQILSLGLDEWEFKRYDEGSHFFQTV